MGVDPGLRSVTPVGLTRAGTARSRPPTVAEVSRTTDLPMFTLGHPKQDPPIEGPIAPTMRSSSQPEPQRETDCPRQPAHSQTDQEDIEEIHALSLRVRPARDSMGPRTP